MQSLVVTADEELHSYSAVERGLCFLNLFQHNFNISQYLERLSK